MIARIDEWRNLRRPGSRIAFAALGTLLAPSPLLSTLQDPVGEYRGKYAGETASRERLGKIEVAWRKALREIERKLALAPSDPRKISVEIRDALAPDADPIVAFRGEPVEVVREGEDRVVLRVRAEFVVRRAVDLEGALERAGVIAVLTERLGERSMRTLAPWMVEGLAVWAADVGPALWLAHLRSNPTSTEPAERFYGVGVGEPFPERQVENGLAIDLLAARKGPKAPLRLAAYILQREDVFDMLRSVSGLEWGAFRAGARKHALEKVRSWTPKEWDAYAALARIEREGAGGAEEKLVELERACGAFASRNKASRLLPDVLFWQGKALARLGRVEEALVVLRRAAETDPGDSPYGDDIGVEIGGALFSREDLEGALAAFGRVLRDYPESPLLDRALAGKARSLAKGGKKEDALRAIDLFERSFPESASITEMRELRRALSGE